MVILHVLGGKCLHPIDERCLFDDVHRSIKIEAPRRSWLEVTKIQIWVRQAILRAREHARIHKLVSRYLPLGEHRLKVHPIETVPWEVNVNHDALDAVQEQARRTEHALNHALFGKVCQLGSSKIGRIQTLIAFVPQMVKDKVHKVAIDATCGDSETFLRLALLPFCKVRPCHFHLLVHAADKHRMLRPRSHALEDKERRHVVFLESIELLVHKAEDTGRNATECICKGVLQSLNGTKPEDCINPDSNIAQTV
mmetsp:Transcript_88859/g.162929  ORF Transcript_88859/g.162929 Transcript_88859/m.162929 type:complete len:253 (+) Transcript_88859:1502-2260(+)